MRCSTESSTSKPGRKPGARSTVYCGLRPWIEPGVEDVAEARTAFLFAVERQVPGVIAGLVSAFRARGPARGTAVLKWAQRHGLTCQGDGQTERVPDWIAAQANATFHYWALPEFVGCVGKNWGVVAGGWTCETGIAPERQELAAQLAQHPRYGKLMRLLHQPQDAEPLPEKQYALRYRNAMRPLAQKLGFVERPAPLPWQFFEAAARFQCGGEPIAKLAAEFECSEAAARRGINRVLGLCGLTRRGRTRRSETAKSKPSS